MHYPLTLVHLLLSSLKLCPDNAKLSWESHKCSFSMLLGMYFPHCNCSLQFQIYTERTAVTNLDVLHPCIYHFRMFQESVSVLCGRDIEVLLKNVVHLGIKLTDSENKKPTSMPLQLKVLNSDIRSLLYNYFSLRSVFVQLILQWSLGNTTTSTLPRGLQTGTGATTQWEVNASKKKDVSSSCCKQQGSEVWNSCYSCHCHCWFPNPWGSCLLGDNSYSEITIICHCLSKAEMVLVWIWSYKYQQEIFIVFDNILVNSLWSLN